MNYDPIEVPKDEAKETLAAYQEVKHKTDFDEAMITALRSAVRKDVTLIDVGKTIVAAGVNEDCWPRLGFVRADYPYCHCHRDVDWKETEGGERNRTYRMAGDRETLFRSRSTKLIRTCRMMTPRIDSRSVSDARAITPVIPVDKRPKFKLSGYHILFEAVWEPQPPIDPILLKHVGGDLYRVIAEWDLADLERAVLGAIR